MKSKSVDLIFILSISSAVIAQEKSQQAEEKPAIDSLALEKVRDLSKICEYYR